MNPDQLVNGSSYPDQGMSPAGSRAKQRLPMIDIAKGLGILLIVLGHSHSFRYYFPELNEILRSIRVPFFFFVSGVMFSVGKKSLKDIAVTRTDAWLKPYAVTVILFGAIDIYIKHSESFQTVFLGLVYGTGFTLSPVAIWFLPHLWLMYMVFSAVLIHGQRLIDTTWKKFGLIAALLILGSYVLDAFDSTHTERRYSIDGFNADLLDFGLPFSADLLPITGAFFLLGHFLSSPVKQCQLQPLRASAAIVSIVLLRHFFDASVDLNFRLYDHLAASTLQAVLGIFVLLNASLVIIKLKFLSGPLVLMGKASLFILLFHMPLLETVPTLLEPYIGSRSVQGIFAVFCSIILPMLFWKIAQRQQITRAMFFPIFSKKHRPERLAEAALVVPQK